MSQEEFHPCDVLFRTFGQVLKRGQLRRLQEDDATNLLVSESPKVSRLILGQSWERRKVSGKSSLALSIFDVYKGMLLFTGLLHLFDIGMLFVAPPLIRILVDRIHSQDMTLGIGVLYAIGLSVAPCIQTFASNHFEINSQRLGMRCMGGVSCLIFDKILKLSQPASVAYGPGKLANIMQLDTFRFQHTFYFVHFIWSMPLMVVIAVCMISQM